jgi:leucyl aminopeptidase
MISIRKTSQHQKDSHLVVVADTIADIPKGILGAEEVRYIKKQQEQKKALFGFNRLDHWIWIYMADTKKERHERMEACRVKGDSVCQKANAAKAVHLTLFAPPRLKAELLAFAEGVILGNYQFGKYKTDTEEKAHSLQELTIACTALTDAETRELEIITDAVCRCRDLVNEPVNHLNAEALADAFARMGKEAGFSVEVLNKSRIEALKMGGLLAVNLGSPDPPTFTIMEYHPKNAVNKKPYVLVGKGVTFDTGGISLKPSASMTEMKCDMSGAAAVGTAIYAIAKAKLPVWIISLAPATDNRPSGNAQVPGDIISMYDGSTVEVLNTDAEGRLLLADALAYAKKYKPALVVDIATLTGAAHAAIGKYAIVSMGAKCKKEMELLKDVGASVHERIVEFPFWDDYKDLLKSEVADLKNIGGPVAGAITAGKFLEHFTDYPYIHLDIAGPAFGDKRDSWRGTGGSGVGVRLFFQFFKKLSKSKA